MKVAILTEGSEDVGSTYWRALQHVPRLERRGARTTVFVPASVPRRLKGPLGRPLFFGEHALRYLARGVRLRRALPHFDAVFVQRGAYPMGPAWIVKSLDRFRGRVVFDLDDNVFTTSPDLATRSAAARWLYGPEQARYLLRRADKVIVSTVELDKALPGRDADIILPSAPDISGYPVARHDPGLPIRVGWVGNPGNLIYLDSLRQVFERLRANGIAELEVLCPEPWRGPSIHRAWRRDEEVAALATYDVGIMPLTDTPYTRAKAGFKLLMYMGVGSPVIASPVGINAELVERSRAGLLAVTPEEWDAAIRRLAADASLRERMGRAGRDFVQSYGDMERQADTVISALSGEPMLSAQDGFPGEVLPGPTNSPPELDRQ